MSIEQTNKSYRDTLRAVEAIAANALAHQPEDDAQAEIHLGKALAKIELRIYAARHCLDMPPPRLITQPAGARGIAEAGNGDAEADRDRVGREAVAQEGRRSNTGQ